MEEIIMFVSLDESIGLLSNQTNRKMVRYVNLKLKNYDITLEQWVVLLVLSKEDIMNQKQLAQKVEKDQPTLARILDILERKNLIERQSIKEDRRSFLVHITDLGINHKQEVATFLEDVFEKMLTGIPKAKIDIYKEVMLQVNQNITNQLQEWK
jgi:DNA-binding MarR family transcriptional regulator